MPCSCHSDLMYASLIDCPGCGHKSLDVGKTWAGCERRKCGWQTESRRGYGGLLRYPAWGLYEGAELLASIRAESAQAARILLIGNYGRTRGDRVRRIA